MTTGSDHTGEVIAAHLSDLTLPGVLTVRPGWKFRDGWPVTPPTPAIVVTVADKTTTPAGGRLLPTEVDGVAVDVRQASPRKATAVAAAAAAAQVGSTDAPPDKGGLPIFNDEIRPDGTPATASRPALPTVPGGVAPAELSAAASKPQLPYTAPDSPALAPVTGTVTVQAAASPDAGWPVLRSFLGSVTATLTIGLYDWTSKHVLDTFTTDLAGKTVNLVLDHPALNPTADQTDEATVAALKSVLGEGLSQAWALERSDPLAAVWLFPSAYHIKVAVADHARVWLSSGNWNNSNQPDIEPVAVPSDADAARSGDRDWHVVIDSPDLAAVFEAYLLHDLTVAAQHQITPAAAAPELAAQTAAETAAQTAVAPAVIPAAEVTPAVVTDVQTPPFAQFFPPTTVTASMTITPVLTPDTGSYAPHITALIASATTSLYLQFQYIELPKDPTTASPAFTGLIAAVVARQRAGVDVRIVMSEYEVQGYLEQLMTARLDVATAVKIQNNVHNKGIVVDGTTVLVSSQNWSNAGTTSNRDAGVIITDRTLAGYFQTLFLHDWDHLAAQSAAED